MGLAKILKKIYKRKKIARFFPRYSNYDAICNYYVQCTRIYLQESTFTNANLAIQTNFRSTKYHLYD